MLVFEHLDVEDGGPTAGRRGKLTTGNISCRIMRQLIFRTIVGGGTALRNHRPKGKHYVRDGPLYGTVHRLWLGRRYSSCVSGSNR